ncbi:MAG: Ig-like domain-containing protein [Pseudomonadota bacterium]
MSVWLKKGWAVLLAAVVLAGCGGSGTSDDTEEPTGPVAASIELSTDTLSLASSGTETALIRALVKDSSNVVLSGVTVNFSSDSGSIAVTQNVTDADGFALANLTTGNNRANRNITVTAQVAGSTLSDTLLIPVVGSTLAINAPSSVTAGSTANITLVVRDSDNNGLPNQQVTLTSSLSNSFTPTSPLTTGPNGSVSVTYNATASGTDTLTATALDGSVSATQQMTVSGTTVAYALSAAPAGDIAIDDLATAGALEGSTVVTLTWTDNGAAQAGRQITFSTTRGKFDVDNSNTATVADTSVQSVTTNAAGQASVRVFADNAGTAVVTAAATNGPSTQLSVSFVSVKPSAVAASASPASLSPNGDQSTITAIVRDAEGNLVKNARVVFSLQDVSGGQISPGFADTNASGVASTVYTSNAASASNGVVITATVNNCDVNEDGVVAVGETCSSQVFLTVANASLFITIGTGNQVQEPNETQYVKEFTVFITDSNGNARADQPFQASVIPLPDDGSPFNGTDDVDDPTTVDGIYNKSAYFKGFYVWTGSVWAANITERCRNEDVDTDGVLDPGEEHNGDDVLTPGLPVAIDATSDTRTDSSGFGTIRLRYPQEYANWVQVRIAIKAAVSGTESTASKIHTLVGAATDFNRENVPPPGQPSPFGISNSCANTD